MIKNKAKWKIRVKESNKIKNNSQIKCNLSQLKIYQNLHKTNHKNHLQFFKKTHRNLKKFSPLLSHKYNLPVHQSRVNGSSVNKTLKTSYYAAIMWNTVVKIYGRIWPSTIQWLKTKAYQFLRSASLNQNSIASWSVWQQWKEYLPHANNIILFSIKD